MSRFGRTAHSRRRRVVTTTAAFAAAAALIGPLGAMPAQGELRRAGPTDDATGIPAWYEDRNGLRLGVCDDTAHCEVEAGEMTYWSAEAAMTQFGGRARLVLGLAGSQEDPTLPPSVGGEVVIRARGLRPNTRYKVTHPFGVRRLLTSNQGRMRFVGEAGCEVEQEPGGPAPAPCNFAAALGAPIGPFLTWHPKSRPRPPAGFIGDGGPLEQTSRITGSPRGTNFFRIEGPGLGRRGITTRQFLVQGKVVGASRPGIIRRSDTGRSRTDDLTRDRTPRVRGLAEPGSTVEIAVDGTVRASGTATRGTYAITLPRLSQGRHRLRARAADGEVRSLSTGMRMRLDTRDPRIGRVRARRFNLNRRNRSTISFRVSEGTRIRTKVMRNFRVKNFATRVVRQPRRVTIRWGGRNNRGRLVREGVYHVRVTATDRAGNRTVRDSRTFRVIR